MRTRFPGKGRATCPVCMSLFFLVTEANTRWPNTPKWKPSPSNWTTRTPEGRAGSFLRHLTTECGPSHLPKKKCYSWPSWPTFFRRPFHWTGTTFFFSSRTFLLGVKLQSCLWGALLGISLFPFQPRPLRQWWGLGALPTGSGIWSIQQSLKNALPTLLRGELGETSLYAVKNRALYLRVPQGSPALRTSPSFRLVPKRNGTKLKKQVNEQTNRIARIQCGALWGRKFRGRLLKVLGVKGVGVPELHLGVDLATDLKTKYCLWNLTGPPAQRAYLKRWPCLP